MIMAEATVFIPHFGFFAYSHEDNFIKDGIEARIRKDILDETTGKISVTTHETGLSYLSSHTNTFFCLKGKTVDYDECNAVIVIYGGNQTCWYSNIITSLTKQTTILKKVIEQLKRENIPIRKKPLALVCIRLSRRGNNQKDELDEIVIESVKLFMELAKHRYVVSLMQLTEEGINWIRSPKSPKLSYLEPSLDSIVNGIRKILSTLDEGVVSKKRAIGEEIGEDGYFDIGEAK